MADTLPVSPELTSRRRSPAAIFHTAAEGAATGLKRKSRPLGPEATTEYQTHTAARQTLAAAGPASDGHEQPSSQDSPDRAQASHIIRHSGLSPFRDSKCNHDPTALISTAVRGEVGWDIKTVVHKIDLDLKSDNSGIPDLVQRIRTEMDIEDIKRIEDLYILNLVRARVRRGDQCMCFLILHLLRMKELEMKAATQQSTIVVV